MRMGTLAHNVETLRSALAATHSGDVIDIQMTVDHNIAELFFKLLDAQKTGGAVVVPKRNDLTPAEVAAILGVSRPQVYKMIDEGLIEDRPVGKHHRIPAASLARFQERQKKRSLAAMAELTSLSNDLGFTE